MIVKEIQRRFQKLCKKVQSVFRLIAEIPYKIRRYYNRKKIKSRDFTVISNNCWAGKLYQYLDMPYLSPTVGLYFFADDYLKFVSNLKYYLSLELQFIPGMQSKYRDRLLELNHINKPIGLLGDVEIVFLHYRSEDEAREKWNRRKMRINWENMFIKFSKMNLCTENHMKAFANLPIQNKFLLNNRKKTIYPCEIYWNGQSNDKEILLDTDPFPGNICLGRVFKNMKVK